MSFEKNLKCSITENSKSLLLQEIRLNWKWILISYDKILREKANIKFSISDIYEPRALSGSLYLNNNSMCLHLASSPEAVFALFPLKKDLMEIINSFFHKEIINNIICISTI